MDAVKALRQQQLAEIRAVQIEDGAGKRALRKEMFELERRRRGLGVVIVAYCDLGDRS